MTSSRARQRRRSSTVLFASSVLMATILAGCSDDDGSATTTDPLAGYDLSNVSDAHAAEIEDREATREEYQAAFQRYRDCLSAEGFELIINDLDAPILDFGIPEAAVLDGADEECYQSEFTHTDFLWQTRPENQDLPDDVAFRDDCVERLGLDPVEDDQELRDRLAEAGHDFGDCLS